MERATRTTPMPSWCGDKWWHEEQYQRLLNPRISLAEVDAAVQRVSEVFTSEWVQQAAPHPAWTFLLPKGTLPLSSLLALGFDLVATDGTPGLQSIVHDLRQTSQYVSTRLELSIAAALVRAGH